MSETSYQDAESYSPDYMKDKISFRDIVLQHVRRISTFSCVEFRGGYWDKKTIYSGNATNEVNTYISDTREIYSNSVEVLADMLFPYFDDQMKESEEKCNAEINQAFEKNTRESEDASGKSDSGEKMTIRIFPTPQHKSLFSQAKRTAYRELFRALCAFLYRKKYLELGTIED